MQAAYMKAGEAPPPYIGKAFALLGYIGLGSIITLWVTGFGLAHLIYGGLAINGAFMKTAGRRHRAVHFGLCQPACVPGDQGQAPAERGLMKRLVQAGRVGLLLAIGGAAVAFSA